MKHWLTPVLLFCIAGLFVGCRSGYDVIATGVRVELTQVDVGADGSIQVNWRVSNPNVVSYLWDHSLHKVSLNGTLVGTVTDSQRLGVPPQNHADRVSSLKPASADAVARIRQLAGSSANYSVDSTAWILIVDDDLVKTPFQGSGNVPVVAK